MNVVGDRKYLAFVGNLGITPKIRIRFRIPVLELDSKCWDFNLEALQPDFLIRKLPCNIENQV